jgi:predicted nucleic-acid-binding Zn-ribbon protein
MTPEQTEAIVLWERRNKIPATQRCPVCGAAAWNWTDIMAAGLSPDPAARETGLGGPRLLRRRCDRCGFSMFFDAAVVGV